MNRTRRLLVVLGIAALLSAGCEGTPEPSFDSLSRGATSGMRLRLATGNLSSGNYSKWEDSGTRIIGGIHPDVALLQEFNVGDNSDAAIGQWVSSTFGSGFQYATDTGAQIPNAVVSHYPILQHGVWKDPSVSNRGFTWAEIQIPGSKRLWAVSVHLLTTSTTNRNTEATNLVQDIRSAMPPSDYLVIAGDLNTGSRSESCLKTLSSLVTASAPFPADQSGNANTNSSRKSPYDWVLVDASLAGLQTAVTIGSNTFPSGLVVDTRAYQPIADLAPALAADSGAASMQHMAVVKDFELSAPIASLAISSPSGGESWSAGSRQNIGWTSTGIANLSIDYSLDAGSTWSVLSANVPASSSPYSWTLPKATSDEALVRLSDATTGLSAQSAAFKIVAGTSCGDGVCSGAETCVTCPADCGACPASDPILVGAGDIAVCSSTDDEATAKLLDGIFASSPAGGSSRLVTTRTNPEPRRSTRTASGRPGAGTRP